MDEIIYTNMHYGKGSIIPDRTTDHSKRLGFVITKDHIYHPQPQHHSNHAFGFIHPCIAAAITLIQQIGDKRQCRAKGAAARWRGEQGFQFGMDRSDI